VSQPDGERIAVLETEVAALKDTIKTMAGDLHTIKEAVTSAQGGWKTLVALGTVVSASTGLVTWLFSHFH